MVWRQEFLDALTLLAKASDIVEAKTGHRPVLVGGAAVEFYSGSAVTSGDFDLVAVTHEAVAEALIHVGFRPQKKRGSNLRYFLHEDIPIAVEIVAARLMDGLAERDRGVLVQIAGGRVEIIALEDLIADRMGQFNSQPGGRQDMLDQAVKLLLLAEEIDRNYLKMRIHQETSGDYDLRFLEDEARNADGDD